VSDSDVSDPKKSEAKSNVVELPTKKSMAEFDYFSDDVPFAGVSRGQQSLTALKRRKRRLFFHAALIIGVCVLLGALVFGLRETIFYHFRTHEAVQIMGRVDELEPGTLLPHDRYVRLSGVTEARAAQVRWIRGLDWRANYKYYHLLGSPVFIEVPADESQGKVDAFQTIELEGRLVDLTRVHEYDRLLEFLETNLRLNRPEHPYMLQVGVKPDGGKKAIILLWVVILIPALNIALWVRAWRRLSKRRI
jgi:hypothetical protein